MTSEKSGLSITQLPAYFRGSVDELKKVSHPTRAETIQATIATLVIIFFVSFCLFLLDQVFGRIMAVVFQ